MLSTLQRTWPWLLVAVAIIYGVVGAAEQLGFPTPEFWTANASSVSALLFWLSAVVIVWSTVQVLRQQGEIRSLSGTVLKTEAQLASVNRLRQLEVACKPLLVIIAEDFRVPILTLGIHVWRVDERNACLKRVTAYRVHSRLGSGITWTMGKGVVGRCWRDQLELVIDLGKLKALGKRRFDAMSMEERFGLDWGEMERSREYEAVWATPAKTQANRLVGCVSIDCYEPGSATKLQDAANSPTVQGIVGTIRSLLVQVVEESIE